MQIKARLRGEREVGKQPIREKLSHSGRAGY
jgi:hypothetical protein